MKVTNPGQAYYRSWLTEKEVIKLDIKTFLAKASKDELKQVLKFIRRMK